MSQLNMDLNAPETISAAQWRSCVESQWLSDFDVAMAQWMARHVPNAPPELLWMAALLARQSGQGHVHVRISDVFAEPARYGLATDSPAWACLSQHTPASLQDMLAQSPAVANACAGPEPLVLDGDALYWQRAWQEECAVALSLRLRIDTPVAVDNASLDALIDALFDQPNATNADQRAACRLAAQRALTVITGGPGTGKTTTVVRVLAILQSLAVDTPLRMALAAPTGKAAARLSESIAQQVATLPITPTVAALIPTEVSTVHRLLGVTSRGYRHQRSNPLALDVLVVDEASMLDLSLMAALLDALPNSARIILLGDKDQLASVEAGAVLADICALEQAPVAELRHSFRFDASRGIGKLAQAVCSGHATQAPTDDAYAPEVRRLDDLNALYRGYDAYWQTLHAGAPAQQVLASFERYRLLCGQRQGSHGVIAINAACERYLRGWQGGDSAWYCGRPVMITHNDYSLRLMNGDIGICLPEPSTGELRVAFWDGPAQAIRWLLPSRLTRCESVFAMTVHKSQGSEFTRVAVILPKRHSPVLTRELIYTALTRAREHVDFCIPNSGVWRQTIDERAQRFSGLRHRLAALAALHTTNIS